MKFIAIAALFLATAMAVPTEYYPGGNDGGDGGMTGGDYPSGGDNNGGGDDGSDSGSDGGSGGMAYQPCASGLYSNSQCCATNVLGVAALDCENRESSPPLILNATDISQPRVFRPAPMTSRTAAPWKARPLSAASCRL